MATTEPTKKKITVLMPTELYDKVKHEAEKEKRNVSTQVAYIVDKFFENQESK
jgi:hypothetical protein